MNGVGGFTLGGLASFLTFNKSFSMPINQVSMQLNAIVMAMAGAERIFRLLDEKQEVDESIKLLKAIQKMIESATKSYQKVDTSYKKAKM